MSKLEESNLQFSLGYVGIIIGTIAIAISITALLKSKK